MISLGLVLLVKGETQFDVLGFMLVMLASMLSGLRWTITQVLLQGSSDGHGEPLSVTSPWAECASQPLANASKRKEPCAWQWHAQTGSSVLIQLHRGVVLRTEALLQVLLVAL